MPQLLGAAAHGIPGVVAAGGVYACSSLERGVRPEPARGARGGSSGRRPRPRRAAHLRRGRDDRLPRRHHASRFAANGAPPCGVLVRLDPARAARARSLVEKRFTIDAMAGRLVELYERVTRRPALRAAYRRPVSPDYISHYLPLSAVGSALRDAGREVVVATGAGLRERVLGRRLRARRATAGGGATPRPRRMPATRARPGLPRRHVRGNGPRRSSTRHDGRLHDLLWIPSASRNAWRRSSTTWRPEVVLLDYSSPSAHRSRGAPSACRTRRSSRGTRASCRHPGNRSAIPHGGLRGSRRSTSSRRCARSAIGPPACSRGGSTRRCSSWRRTRNRWRAPSQRSRREGP